MEDALAVIDASGGRQVAPIALAHAGWVAIELRRKRGDQVPTLVLLDWIIAEAPPSFLEALQGMQAADGWRQVVEQIFELWLHGVNNQALHHFVREEIGSYGFDMWARAAREIGAAYAKAGSPLEALSHLKPPVPVLHLSAQPDNPGFLTAQQSFAATNPWFQVRKLDARSHFPMFEVPNAMASAIEEFTSSG